METNEDDESSSNQTTMIQAILHKGEDERDLPRNVTHLVVHHSFDWPDSCFLSNLERLVTVTLQSGVKKIAANSFACCMSLREVSIPSTVEIIEHSAFSCCVSLALVNLHHEGLQCIGDEAFMNCKSLCTVSIPSTTIRIGERAFKGCKSLLGVEFAQGPALNWVSSFCFDGCPALVNVFLPSLPQDIELHSSSLGSSHADGSTGSSLSRIVDRYAHLPFHKCCYYASTSTVSVSELTNLLEASSDDEKKKKDVFGWTPFHTVATSPKPRLDLFQALLDDEYYSLDALSQRDLFQTDEEQFYDLMDVHDEDSSLGTRSQRDQRGTKTMLDYLLMNSTPRAIPLIQLVLQKVIVEQMDQIGMMEPSIVEVSLLVDSLNWNGNLEVRRQCLDNVLALSCICIKAEAPSLLELALWKKNIKAHETKNLFVPRSAKRRKMDRDTSRMFSGASVVIPNVIGFLSLDNNTRVTPTGSANNYLSMLPSDASWMKKKENEMSRD